MTLKTLGNCEFTVPKEKNYDEVSLIDHLKRFNEKVDLTKY